MACSGLSTAVLVLCAAPSLTPAATRYEVIPTESRMTAHVGRAGLLKFAGHEHEVVSPAIEGEIVADPADLAASRVHLRIPTSSLRVSGRGEPEQDVPKVQARMEGPDVLDVARFPEVTFASRVVKGQPGAAGAFAVTIVGDLTLHGTTRAVELAVDVVVAGDTLTATGRFSLRQDDYGLKPVSVAGVVNVKNEIAIDLRVVARARPADGSVK